MHELIIDVDGSLVGYVKQSTFLRVDLKSFGRISVWYLAKGLFYSDVKISFKRGC